MQYRSNTLPSGAVRERQGGFTLIEIIVVVAVIAILATITIVSYNGVVTSSRNKEVSGEATTIGGELKKLRSDAGAYPSDLSSIKQKSAFTYAYTYFSDNDFCLSVARYGLSFRVTDSNLASAEPGSCVDSCPNGFILVPGNATFGTSNFCVMKYEAKVLGVDTVTTSYRPGLVAESRASGAPWVNISQTDAITEAQATCAGCHLITEAEWMTIAADVLSVASNWSGGAVGSGYIYQGHVNYSPGEPLPASSNDSDGLYGYTANIGGLGMNNRRTLTLTNGEVIWDMSGNVHDMVDSNIPAGQQPGLVGESAFAFKQWNNASLVFRGLVASSRPSAISATVGGYSSTQGIGQLYSNYGDSSLRAVNRGGSWGGTTYAGLLMVNTGWLPSTVEASTGFRVAR